MKQSISNGQRWFRSSNVSWAVSLCAAICTGPAHAEETTFHEDPIQSHAEHSPHKFEVGIALTHSDDDDAFTLAASYGYRFAKTTSIGVLAEYAFDPIDAWVIGAPLKYYTPNAWVFTAMPGVERHESHNKGLLRIGIGYEFEVNGRSITPEISASWVDDETEFLVGLMFGF